MQRIRKKREIMEEQEESLKKERMTFLMKMLERERERRNGRRKGRK